MSSFFSPSPPPTLGQQLSSYLEGPSTRRLLSTLRRAASPHYRTNTYIVYGVLGLNAGVFAYYHYTRQQAKAGFPKNYIDFCNNFLLRLNNVEAGKWWTMFTSTVTHFNLMHIAGNAISFYYLGKMLATVPALTPFKFATLIVGSGFAGSAVWLAQRQAITKKSGQRFDRNSALGFSGVVMGVGAAAALFFPYQKMLIYGIVPVPLWALMLGYAAYDGYYLNSQNSKTAHAGHIGGGLFGVAYYFLRLRGLGRGF